MSMSPDIIGLIVLAVGVLVVMAMPRREDKSNSDSRLPNVYDSDREF